MYPNIPSFPRPFLPHLNPWTKPVSCVKVSVYRHTEHGKSGTGENDLYRTTIICIDSYQNSVLAGRLYAEDLGYRDRFHSTVEFLKKMAALADQEMLPQAFQQFRSFQPPRTPIPDLPPDPTVPTGELATFALRILFRQNATWQGSLFWLDKDREEHYRSVLELLFLLDSTLSSETDAPQPKNPSISALTQEEEKPVFDELDQISLTKAMIGEFLECAEKRGLGSASLRTYRSALQMLYDFLPPDKPLTENTASAWKEAMEKQGLTPQTIYSRIYILNALLRHLGKESWTAERVSVTANQQNRSQLTLEEYQQLVTTAESIGKYRAALLMKTIMLAGCRPQELNQLTVEALRSGTVTVTSYGSPHQLEIPAEFMAQLLAYIEHQGLQTGPIFVSKDGNPLHHTMIWKEIKVVCRHAGIAPEKGNPSNFFRLYQSLHPKKESE